MKIFLFQKYKTKNWRTDATLDVDIIAPGAILLAVDDGPVLPIAGVAPALARTVVLYGGGVRPRILPGLCPVVFPHVVVTN